MTEARGSISRMEQRQFPNGSALAQRIGRSAVKVLCYLVPLLPRGRGAVPRFFGKALGPIHFTLRSAQGLELPVNTACLDSYVFMLNQERGWVDDVLRTCSASMEGRHVMYDVGAHLGYVGLHLAHSRPDAQVIAFEPQPSLADTLRQTISLNKLENVTVAQYLISDADSDSAIIYIPAHLGQASHIWSKHCRSVSTSMRTLDTLALRDKVIPLPDLIKIDVEGAELEVLRGAQGIVATSSPVIIFEHNACSLRYGYTLSDIASLLNTCGRYTLFGLKGYSLVTLVPSEMPSRASTFNDFVAIPS